MDSKLRRKDLVYPELSYKVIGVLFEVFNELGYQYQEKYYQRAVRETLKNLGIKFQEQVSIPMLFKAKVIGRYFYDFVIEGKIVLEIKRGDGFSKRDIQQVLGYLKQSGLSLGILARFSSGGLKYKRIINLEK